MEQNAEEAITNNILGTQNVLCAAERNGAGRVVMISTDKAVNPTCIMGATKRLGEWLVMAAAKRSGKAYMAVRFGNVLGSRGSVIHVFQQQIAAGGPVTVTHPQMRRYFMSIPEAVQLVLQAAVLGRGGEVFVLDMGQPVCIRDLANNLIELSGLEPGCDIEIVYSGIRPGEKLSEELFLEDEDHQRTKHKKILVVDCRDAPEAEILQQIVAALIDLVNRTQTQSDMERLRTVLLKACYYIDKYQPRRALPEPIALSTPALQPSSLHPLPSSTIA
jgi:FlaA1/EpsC-like NDP-sugar epimerase